MCTMWLAPGMTTRRAPGMAPASASMSTAWNGECSGTITSAGQAMARSSAWWCWWRYGVGPRMRCRASRFR